MGELRRSQWRCRECKKVDPRSKGASPSVKEVPTNVYEKSLLDKIAEIEKHLRGVSDLREEWNDFKKTHKGKSQIFDQTSGFEEKLKGFEALKGEVRHIREELRSLDIRISSLEQSRVAKEVEIHGMPQDNQAHNIKGNIIKIAEIAGIHVETSDFVTQEVKNGKKSTSFHIVKFSDISKRNGLLNGLKIFNKTKNIKEKLNTSHLGSSEEGPSPIYVNPRLTHPTRRVYQMGRRLKRDGKIDRVWVYSSKVFIRRKSEDKPIAVYNCADLESLVGAVDVDVKGSPRKTNGLHKSLKNSVLTSPPHDKS
jgi:hypothetical protein